MRRFHLQRTGFTLIELMVAMVVLSILMVMVATIFNDATKAWTLGTRRAETNGSGRAVVDFMARELSAAIADEQITFIATNDFSTAMYESRGDLLAFVAANRNPENSLERTTEEVWYYAMPMKDSNGDNLPGRYRLMRAAKNVTAGSGTECYTNKGWWRSIPSGGALIENISAFEVRAYHHDVDKNNVLKNFYSKTDAVDKGLEHALPDFVEIYLEVLDEKDAMTAQMMYDNNVPDKDKFVERRAKRYTARVYPNSREGYRILP